MSKNHAVSMWLKVYLNPDLFVVKVYFFSHIKDMLYGTILDFYVLVPE